MLAIFDIKYKLNNIKHSIEQKLFIELIMTYKLEE